MIRRLFDPAGLDPWIARRLPWGATVEGVLDAAACDALVARIDALEPDVAPINLGYAQVVNRRMRDNERVMFDDTALAAALWTTLGPTVPATWERGRAVGLNERFRGYRYSPGQRFAPHFDGSFQRDADERSEITVLVYLNEGCAGGDTAFCDHDLRVTPRRGMALLFQHDVLHEGSPVTAGRKYVLRTDVMYRR